MALLPLFVMTLVESRLTHRTIENEMKCNMSKILNAAVTSISLSHNLSSHNLEKSALKYITLLNSGENNDIFMVDKNGTLLTPSFHYGKTDTLNALNIQQFDKISGIEEIVAPNGKTVIAGYAQIPDSSLMLILVKNKKWLADLWFKPRLKLIGYLAVSILLILLSIMGMATYLIGRIHSADQKRIKALHHAEHANKLASIGRLASGVAHEINNPLAIINQKTGLIMDLFTLKENLSSNEKLMSLANDILDTVKRCGTITHRLLNFSQHMESSIQPVDIILIINQILAFLEKEAERRRITILIDNKNKLPEFECDRGSLQQIFLNLIENAFAAMKDGGQLKIRIHYKAKKNIIISITDNGKGIPDDDIHKIFEPFYSSKTDHWGSGLGLSITYGLIKKIGGDIRVKSKVNEGTCFTLTLPLTTEAENGKS